ncbi:leishmanolysin-related zinc metalloendopeptidase [Loktanella sp. DJP18]|uniref:leishmanolysin-related zinc metalloendopeptidase n=1 Tax=Loktanella sp. DJP18 TaxID=3409788 RepID=UPI003BB684EC
MKKKMKIDVAAENASAINEAKHSFGHIEMKGAGNHKVFEHQDAPSKANGPMFGDISSDLDGLGKPAFKGGDAGAAGGGRGKPIKSTVPTEPVVDETPTTPSEPAPAPTPAKADYVSGLDTPDGFNIELMFVGAWSDAAKAQAYAAAENISNTVIGDLPSYNGIDDIRITLTSAAIDGAGGTWGKGGYDALRLDTKLAATGHVTIDSADITQAMNLGLLDDLLQHEMLHAMGFGTAWQTMGLVDNYNGDLRFNGENATLVYNALFQAIASKDTLSDKGVPIETDGGSGAAGKHWDEATFGNELMSTQLNYSNNMSSLTLAALEDMGYQTTFADSFLFA